MGRGALRAACVALALVVATPITAESVGILPAQFSVTGVAADDVLNIRGEPSADAALIGSFDPYRINLEVLALSEDGNWGQVGLPEGNGWVSMRFLERQVVAPDAIPRPMTCIGTEPFWGLDLGLRGDRYSEPDHTAEPETIAERVAHDGYLAQLESGNGDQWTLTVVREWCSDGMSDRNYGLRAHLFMENAGENRMLRGCCTLDGG